MRRCEELPWHLKNNRKWYSLKNFAVSLDTLTLMFFSDLRNEYLQYWELLINGPMFISDETEKEHFDIIATENEYNNDMINAINKIEEVVLYSTNRTDMDVKKVSLKNQIVPFDIIQELNRSVERWKFQYHPKYIELQLIVNLIGKFLCAFTLRCYDRPLKPTVNTKKDNNMNPNAAVSTINNDFSAVAPQYLRQLIDLKHFATLGITLEERNSNDLNLIKTKNKKFLKLKSVAELSFFNESEPNDSVTAVTSSVNVGSPQAGVTMTQQQTQAGQNQNATSNSNDKLFPSKNQIIGNLYLYLRWVWLQFPWIALDNAQSIGGKRMKLLETQYIQVSQPHINVRSEDSPKTSNGMMVPFKSTLNKTSLTQSSVHSVNSSYGQLPPFFDMDELLDATNTNNKDKELKLAAGIKKSLIATLGNTLASSGEVNTDMGGTGTFSVLPSSNTTTSLNKLDPKYQKHIESMSMVDLYAMTSDIVSRTAHSSGDILAVASNRLFSAKKYDPTASVMTMGVNREAHRTHAVLATALKSTERELGVIDTGTKNIALDEDKGIDIKNVKHPGFELVGAFHKQHDHHKHKHKPHDKSATANAHTNGRVLLSKTTGSSSKASTAVIPFSSHSLRTLHHKSMFPTLEKQRADKLASQESDDTEFYEKANAVVRFGGQGAGDPSLWAELQAIAEEQAVKYYDAVHGMSSSSSLSFLSYINKLFYYNSYFYVNVHVNDYRFTNPSLSSRGPRHQRDRTHR